MIGSFEKLIAEKPIPHSVCPECNASNTLTALVSSKIFLLKLFPFVYGKTAKVSCASCKKMFPFYYYMPATIQDKVTNIMIETKHKWYGYIGYVVFGGLIVLSFFINPKK